MSNDNSYADLAHQKHPKAFYMIFFLEFWERFGYYVMNTVIVYFYFVEVLNFTESHAFKLFGAFSALMWAFIIIGGYIGDKYFGTKRTIVLGSIVLFIGYITLSCADINLMYVSLALIAVGEGLFKANPSSLLSKSYYEKDPRLHTAYTYYYMAINIGSLIATFLAPVIAHHLGWNIAFLLSGLGMVIALANFGFQKKTVKKIGSEPDLLPFKWGRFVNVLILISILTALATFLLQHVTVAYFFTYTLVGISVIIFLYFTVKLENANDRKKMIAALILIMQAVMFYTLYQQMYLSVTFFSLHNVYASILGIPVSQVSFQGFDPVVIVIFSPILAAFFAKNAKSGKKIKITTKFTAGFFSCAIAFSVLWICTYFVDSTGRVHSAWIFLFYVFQGFGEIFIGGLGLAMVAELVVDRYLGFVYGIFFFASAIGSIFGALISGYSAVPKGTTAIQALPVYQNFFFWLTVGTICAFFIVLVIKPLLDWLIKE
ncbi:MAG: oligopeptide:H+ symporter [Victivallales bacterium]|nr:oligopeptide:H+ symporter [Victivallales bacterium]MCF7888882.1 oligopeptide:H+ symporter [Victivallales bacterium]